MCDFAECQVTDSLSKAIRLACFHTIHTSCYSLAGDKCPICSPNLSKTIDELAAAFNHSLLLPTNHARSSSTPVDDDDTDTNVSLCNATDPAYYQSSAWESHINSELTKFNVIQPTCRPCPTSISPQVGHPSPQVSHPSPQVSHPSPQVSQSHPSQVRVNIKKINIGTLTFWLLSHELSQSTLFGRNGSNACTFIAMIVAKSFITSHPGTDPLSVTWVPQFISSMHRGNQLYDSATRSSGQAPLFSVTEAYVHLRPQLGTVKLEETLDLSITTTNPDVPQSSLAFYLPRLDNEHHTAAIVIMNGMTVCFVGRRGNIYIMDSHPHSELGAMLGMSPIQQIEGFLTQIKGLLCPNFNMCSLTFGSF